MKTAWENTQHNYQFQSMNIKEVIIGRKQCYWICQGGGKVIYDCMHECLRESYLFRKQKYSSSLEEGWIE